MIEAHDGTVTVSSEAGRGTCFRIELPLTRPPAPADQAEAPPAIDAPEMRVQERVG